MRLFIAGLNHRTAPVGLREQLAVSSSDLVSRAGDLKSHGKLEEIVLLSTCNRVEIYATAARKSDVWNSLVRLLREEPGDLSAHTYLDEDAAAARHLFRVTAGMDSMVFGETEISGQVKKAYELARGAQLTGATLNRLFQNAFQVGKEIRTRTSIGRGATSVGGVTAELAERIFTHDLSKRSVMIIGAGSMGEVCVRHLAKKGAGSILVSNRSFARAVQLADEFSGRAVRFEDRLNAMTDADIVVASTASPEPWLRRNDVANVMALRRNRPLILIDISVPRNIDAEAQCLDNVFLYNIDDLNALVCENVDHRKQELALCNQIIGERAVALMEKLNSRIERPYELGLQFQANWPSQSAAVAAA